MTTVTEYAETFETEARRALEAIQATDVAATMFGAIVDAFIAAGLEHLIEHLHDAEILESLLRSIDWTEAAAERAELEGLVAFEAPNNGELIYRRFAA